MGDIPGAKGDALASRRVPADDADDARGGVGLK
jgi:hypothetical protein